MEEYQNQTNGKVALTPHLYRFAMPRDVVMMVFGTLAAIVTGSCVQLIALLLSRFANELSLYTVAVHQLQGNTSTQYFCNDSGELLEYLTSTDPEAVLKDNILVYTYYCIGIGATVFLAILVSQILCAVSGLRQSNRMRGQFLHSILQKDIEWFDINSSAELSTYLSENIQIVEEGTTKDIIDFIEESTTLVIGLIIAIVINWKLALVIGSFFPLTLAIIFIAQKIAAMSSVTRDTAVAKAGAIAQEVLSSIRTVIAFGGEKKGHTEYCRQLVKAKRAAYKISISFSIVLGLYAVSLFLGYYGVGHVYGSSLFVKCDISAGDITTVLIAIATGSYSMLNIFPALAGFTAAIKSASAICGMMDQASKTPSKQHTARPTCIKGHVTFEDVCFRYPSHPNITIFDSLQLTVTPGQTVALVGPSGCGKSTIVKLLLRLYSCNSGKITIDNVDINDLDASMLRKQIGIVSQEPVLFNISIADNISLGKQGATQDEIVMAAKMANAHNFICNLPQGYGTVAGEGGCQLSGGQKQRIAIARALIRKPKILLLDEATSALDTESERAVQQALDRASKGRTTIIIAHRLSTVQKADVIYCLNSKGHIVERGNHERLMNNKSLYYNLVTQATNDAIIDPEEKSDHMPAILSRSWSRKVHTLGKRTLSIIKHKEPIMQHLNMMYDCDNEPAVHGKGRVKLSSIIELTKPDFWTILVGLVAASLIGVAVISVYTLFFESFKLYSETDKDYILSGHRGYLVYYTIIAVIVGGCFLLMVLCLNVAGEKLTARLRGESLQAMLRQRMSWFDRPENALGCMMYRITVDVANVNKAVGYNTGFVVRFLSGFIAASIVAFQGSWALALVALPSLIVVNLGQLLQFCLINNCLKETDRLMEKSLAIATETLENIHTVTSLEIKEELETIYKDDLKKPLRIKIITKLIQSTVFGAIMGLGNSIIAVFYTFGIYLYLSDDSASYHIESEVALIRVIASILFIGFIYRKVLSQFLNYHKALISADRILTLLHSNKDTDNKQMKKSLDKVEGNLAFFNLGFVYPSRPEKTVLKGLTLSVKAGHTLALVGPSGSGKSSLVSLVSKFYNPTYGAITLDGVDFRDLDTVWLRQQIGIVSQEPVVFDKSISDNIKYGDNCREVTEEEVIAAAKEANIHDFIMSLPEGYNTNIGLKGTQLSGGQKQRIAIARALIRKPKILLLDEATSALDTESERAVQQALDRASEGRTTIIIAHRLSTIHNADNIVVLSNGCMMEQGTHLELMAQKGMYYYMNTIQNNY